MSIGVWVIALVCVFFFHISIRMRSKVWSQLANTTSRVFISHRQSDTKATAQRLCKDLQREFGNDAIFIDDGGVASGASFPEVILAALRNADTVFVLIGPTWDLDRMKSKDDWVRREIQHSLDFRVVFPVLVDGAKMPVASLLPGEIQRFAEINAEPLSNGEEYESNYKILERIVRQNSPTLAIAKQIETTDKGSLWLICLSALAGTLATAWTLSDAVDLQAKAREADLTAELNNRLHEFPLSFQEFADRNESFTARNVKVVWTGIIDSKTETKKENGTTETTIIIQPNVESYHRLTLTEHPDVSLSDQLKKVSIGSKVLVVARLNNMEAPRLLSGTMTDLYVIPDGE